MRAASLFGGTRQADDALSETIDKLSCEPDLSASAFVTRDNHFGEIYRCAVGSADLFVLFALEGLGVVLIDLEASNGAAQR